MPESPNIYVSNGTCYYNQGYEADSSMIPCGNDYFAHAACCQANDTCLESNACYNAAYGVTYIAGCTDSFYSSDVCPDKFEDLNDPTWMGMAYCNGSSNEWVLCNQPDDPSTIESPAPCSCPTATSDRSMTLSAASSLSATASLPSAVGFEINYMAGHYPTSPAAVTTVSASTTQQSSTGDQGYTITALATVTAPTPTTSSSPSAQATPTSHGLGKNSIIGVSVGSSAGGFLLLAGLVLSFRRRFLARQGQQKVDGANTVEANDKAPTASSNTELAATGGAQNESAGNEQSSWAGSPRTSAVSGSDNRWPRPWSMGSEFDGTGAGTISSVASPGRMQPIWEQDHEQVQRIELAADPLVELEA